MNMRVLVVAAVMAVLVVGGAVLLVPRRSPAPSEPTPTLESASRAATAAVPKADRTEAPASAETPRPRRPAVAGETLAAAAESAAPVTEAAPVAGALRIESDVPGAQVFIDRQFVGATPVTAENLKPGTHQLNVSAEGFDGVARSIEVEAGSRDLMVRFREVRLDVRLPVVHKHRMGSCTGTLVATPQGLRYDSGDKDDAFSAAFADLESFVVDYTDKNLKVKVRKGKQYNFADPDGNADKLFVFHRDVDKARQRLARGDAAGN